MSGTENKNTNVKNIPDGQPQKQFRGVAVHITPEGKFALEPVGVTTLEMFGALTLVIERLKKELQV